MKRICLSNIVLSAALAVVLQVLTGCGSHRKSTVRATSSDRQSYTSVVKSIPSSSFDALPKASQRLLKEADGWLGTPYAYGGTDKKKGVDCSGLTTRVFLDAFQIKMPRNSAEQQQWCEPLGYDDLAIGDLVFFSSKGRKGSVGHVGIYVGNGRMIHSSSSKGVIVSNLSDDYYVRTYHSAGRVTKYYAMIDGKNDIQSSPVLIAARTASAEPADRLSQTSGVPVAATSVSVDKVGRLLSGAGKAAEDTVGTVKTISTVHIDKTATVTTDNPDEARSRALKKLILDD